MNADGAPRQRAPRIEDVARLAGVSTGTVSRVLNGEPNVAEARRIAVQQAIEELGYRPHPIARALRAGRTMTVGLIVRSLRSQSASDLTESLLGNLAESGYYLTIGDTLRKRELEARAVQDIVERRTDALVVLNPHSLRPYFEAHEAGNRVLGIFTPRPDQSYPFPVLPIHYDDAVNELFDELAKLGHERVASVTPVADYRRDPIARARAVREGTIELQQLEAYEALSYLTDEQCMEMARRIVGSGATAFIMTQEVGQTLLRGMKLLRLDIPTDASLALFGRSAWRDLVDPALAAIELDYTEAGRMAAQVILEMLDGGQLGELAGVGATLLRGASIGAAPSRPPSALLGR